MKICLWQVVAISIDLYFINNLPLHISISPFGFLQYLGICTQHTHTHTTYILVCILFSLSLSISSSVIWLWTLMISVYILLLLRLLRANALLFFERRKNSLLSKLHNGCLSVLFVKKYAKYIICILHTQ